MANTRWVLPIFCLRSKFRLAANAGRTWRILDLKVGSTEWCVVTSASETESATKCALLLAFIVARVKSLDILGTFSRHSKPPRCASVVCWRLRVAQHEIAEKTVVLGTVYNFCLCKIFHIVFRVHGLFWHLNRLQHTKRPKKTTFYCLLHLIRFCSITTVSYAISRAECCVPTIHDLIHCTDRFFLNLLLHGGKQGFFLEIYAVPKYLAMTWNEWACFGAQIDRHIPI